MSDNTTNESTASESSAPLEIGGSPIGGASHAVKGPHFTSRPPQVLARVPDLESAESEMVDQTAPGSPDGRMLSSRLSMTILAGGGTLLVAVALALPFLLGGSDTSETTPKDESSAWQPEGPAPSASIAPAWDGSPEGVSSWESAPTSPGLSQTDTPGTSAWPGPPAAGAWNQDSQAASPAQASPAPAWGEAVQAQAWDSRPGAQSWPEQPPTPRWSEPSGAMSPAGQPQSYVAGGEAGRVWNSQVDVASASSPQGQSGWTVPPGPTPGVYRESPGSWAEDVHRPARQVSPYDAAGQIQAQQMAPGNTAQLPSPVAEVGRLSSAATPNRAASSVVRNPADYEVARPDTASYESYDASVPYAPRADTNRTMAIGAYPPAGAFDRGASRQPDPQAVYRAADIRAGLGAGNQVGRHQAGRQSDPHSLEAYPNSRTLPPAANVAAPQPPATGDPMSAYRPTYPVAGASSVPYYGTGPHPQPSEPGVARFRGGIEKATGPDVHDYNRPSIY